jgi:TRAP-type mannitol/chloroaromatic compound transport system permease small subunit
LEPEAIGYLSTGSGDRPVSGSKVKSLTHDNIWGDACCFYGAVLLKPNYIRKLLDLSRHIDRLADFNGWLSGWLIIVTVAVGFYNVVARYVGRLIGIQLSSNTLIDLQWYLFSIMFLLGISYILKTGANVRVDFLYAGWTEQRKALVDFWGTVLFLIPFCILGLIASFNYVLQSWGRMPDGTWGAAELSLDAGGLPRAPIKTMLIFGFVLLLLQAFSQAIKYLAIVKGYTQVAAQVHNETENLPLE